MKGLTVRTIVVAVACAGALGLGELALRVGRPWIGRHSDTMFTIIQHDAGLGWRMRPGVRTQIALVDTQDVEVSANSRGFWDREFVAAKNGSRCRVAFFGDSFTWGFGVRADERFTALLGASGAVETMNFGMPGYGTDQALLAWREVGPTYHADAVVLTIYDNDYRDNLHVVRYGRRKPYFELRADGGLALRGVPVQSRDFWTDGVFHRVAPPYETLVSSVEERRSRIVHWVSKNSDLARLAYTATRVRAAHSDPPARNGAGHADAGRSLTPAERPQVDLLAAIARQFADEVRRTGAGFLVVLAGRPLASHAAVASSLREHGVPVVDVTTDVLARRLGDAALVYWPYNRHWTPAAHRAVAAVVGEAMQSARICRR